MKPDSLIVRSYLWRSATIWLGARLMAAAALTAASSDPVPAAANTAGALILITTLLGLADIHRRHERALLGNLGVSRTTLVALLAGPALIGELTLMIVSG